MLKMLPAQELRGVTLLAIQSLAVPESFQIENLSADKNGNGISIWHRDAVMFSELGHIYKAAQRYYSMEAEPTVSDMQKITQCANLIDAQIRTATRDGAGESTTLVTLAFSGRENLIKGLEMAAARLAEGDKMIVKPTDVGVSRDDMHEEDV
jgi:hypothetical protein